MPRRIRPGRPRLHVGDEGCSPTPTTAGLSREASRMPVASRRTTVLSTIGVAAALSMALAPSSSATVAPLAPVTEAAFAPQLVTVDTPTREDKDRLSALGLDLTEHAGHDYVEVVLHTAADFATLTGAGFTYDVRIADLLERKLSASRSTRRTPRRRRSARCPPAATRYRVLDDFGNEIDELVALRPDIAKRVSIGQSVEGRDLTGIEIGEGVNDPEDGRPVFLMFGAHHAREWPSAELPMEFAHDLVRNYGTDERITELLNRGRAIIVPVSNPDGFDASRTSGDIVDLRGTEGVPYNPGVLLATPGNAYKRKNCRHVDGQTQPAGTCVAIPSPGGFGLGVDLNRNYGALWGGPGTSDNPADPVYRGPAPFSEPETQAIRTLISTRQVTTVITNHTFSNLILRPVGVKPSTIAPDGNPVGFAPDECFTGAEASTTACRRSASAWPRRTATATSSAGSCTTPPARPRTTATTPPAATATPSRSARTSSTRRTSRSWPSTSVTPRRRRA